MSSSYHPPEEPKSYGAAWAVALLIIVAFGLGLYYFPPSFESPKTEVATNVLFVGRFHPILVHTPVGALLLLVLMELLCFSSRGERRYGDAALLTLLIGAAGSVAAVFAGVMLSREGGYVSGNFTLHQGMGVAGTVGILIAMIFRLVAMSKDNRRVMNAYRTLFVLSFSIMGLGAHFGGNMSHGNKFLTEHAPAFMKAPMVSFEKWMLGLVEKEAEPKTTAIVKAPAPAPAEPAAGNAATPTPALGGIATKEGTEEKLVFRDVIMPIFEAKCNNCHNDSKSKGGLRLDSYEWVMKGGDTQADGGVKNIVAGKPDESMTFQLVISPTDDDDHMPPDGKEQPTKEEIEILRLWIAQGASDTQTVASAKYPENLKAAVEAILTASKSNLSAVSPQ